eukprot:CAMPEP_0194296110 /NCGR_PEP_ID=MMETSP0169-20130528/55193_1 /TAXON_ID=218684 /ORGANISM="Corethron pennatum, Strain L29A3" /LENGTH=403 /DNA_ID=CAMNT_0039045477 /DNA_START=143 /DNA_END=1354 /DNA_ORIENTATION=+
MTDGGRASLILSSLAFASVLTQSVGGTPAFIAVRPVTHPPQSSATATLDSETYEIDGTALPPIRPGTFAASVRDAIVERYGAGPARRVLASWNAADVGHERREYVGDLPTVRPRMDRPAPGESNCVQHCTSYVPGLSIREWWWDEDGVAIDGAPPRPSWAVDLEKSFPAIREEFLAATSDPSLASKGSNVWAGALTDDASGYGMGWTTLVLMDRGQWDRTNLNLFPETTAAIRKSGIPCTEAFFASMSPGSNIKLHSDFTNFVLTSHLPLVVPGAPGQCRLSVGDECRPWKEGSVTLFDTSIMHDAINESDETRYILMFRLWHPDLTEEERGALQLIYDCLEHPGLLSADPGEKFMAEQQVAIMKEVPDIVPVGGKGKKKKYVKGKRKNGAASASTGKGFGAK